MQLLACMLISLLEVGNNTHLGTRSWVSQGVSATGKPRMVTHLPHRTVPLCVRHRSSPCIHPCYVCVACTSDNTGLCKEDGMHLSLDSSATVPLFMDTLTIEALQR